MKVIKLSRGQSTIVSDSTFEWAKKYSYHAFPEQYGYYAARSVRSGKGVRKVFLHNEIMEHILSRPLADEEEVDHIDLDKLNNLDDNLRVVSCSLNKQNRLPHKRNRSGYLGVSWSKEMNRWMSKITKDFKTYILGYYVDKIDAAKAYDRKAIELYGELARTNFPKEMTDVRY